MSPKLCLISGIGHPRLHARSIRCLVSICARLWTTHTTRLHRLSGATQCTLVSMTSCSPSLVAVLLFQYIYVSVFRGATQQFQENQVGLVWAHQPVTRVLAPLGRIQVKDWRHFTPEIKIPTHAILWGIGRSREVGRGASGADMGLKRHPCEGRRDHEGCGQHQFVEH